MKILIAIDGYHAHYFIRMGWAKVFSAMGYNVVMWDITKKSAFDAFDEFEPDIFIGHTYHVDKAIFKCIEERPNLKVVMKASDWGQYADKVVEESGFSLLRASQKEIDVLSKLLEKTNKPDILQIHYHSDWVHLTHENWIKGGFKVISLLSAADVFKYAGGKQKSEFQCDISFVGGYHALKSDLLNKYFIPLCQDDYRVKVFGNSHWPIHQYCGPIPEHEVKNLYVSSKICPNVSVLSSQRYGFDIIERPYFLLFCKAFMVTDYVEGLKRLFPNGGFVMASTPEEYAQQIEYYLDKPEERQKIANIGYEEVKEKHTYFERVAQILEELNLTELAQDCHLTKQEIYRKLNIV
jgi:hypothetical protein